QPHLFDVVVFLEVTPGFEPGNQGFADPCLTTWLCHRCFYFIICSLNRNVHCFFKFSFPLRMPTRSCVGILSGAGNEARTRYLHLGKVALYQMSYARKWC
ncbi:Serine/threonine protein phosphatase, partial [Dysosmobacter welbionis]